MPSKIHFSARTPVYKAPLEAFLQGQFEPSFFEWGYEQVSKRDILLALVDIAWLSGHNIAGVREPDYLVRRNIEAGLSVRALVIPVLLDHAQMPRAEHLPESLRPFSELEPVRLRRDHFSSDASSIATLLRTALAEIADADSEFVNVLRNIRLSIASGATAEDAALQTDPVVNPLGRAPEVGQEAAGTSARRWFSELLAKTSAADPSAAKVFLNYRRSDAEAWADRLFERLIQQFSRDNVFMDIDGNIPIGHPWADWLDSQVAACHLMLVLIGRTWVAELKARAEAAENDFVRVEIESALARRIPVVPVFLGDAPAPRSAELPPSIRPLLALQAVRLHRLSFDSDAEALVKGIARSAALARGE